MIAQNDDRHVLKKFRVEGFFGYETREVHFRQNDPTVLTGANGTGKTQTLRILEALVSLDLAALTRLPYRSATLTTADDRTVCCKKIQVADNEMLHVSILKRGLEEVAHTITPEAIEEITSIQLRRFPQVERVGPTLYAERRTGRRIDASQLRSHFPQIGRLAPSGHSLESRRLLQEINDRHISELAEKWPQLACVFIDTKRLDDTHGDLGRQPAAASRQALVASRIEGYLQLIEGQMRTARRQSLHENQYLDSSFAARALDAAHAAIQETSLRANYRDLVQRSDALAANGMHYGEAPPELSERTLNPTEKRILAVFLSDWERRLAKLEPVNRKIELFQTLLNKKLSLSYKGATATHEGVKIVDSYGDEVALSTLSSGEQHLIALFTRLLFSSRKNSLVLIDEPEISLHPAWQHEFIPDLEQISSEVGLQSIIATHSPAIVNGRWDLEEPLKLSRPPRQPPLSAESVGEDDEGFTEFTDLNDE